MRRLMLRSLSMTLVSAFVALQPMQSIRAQAAEPSKPLTIAVGISEPGHLQLLTDIIAQYNTRSGVGEVTERQLVAVMAVDNGPAALAAAQAGLADFAFASLSSFNAGYAGLEDVWLRPLAIEVLTIVTRRNRLVRDPRQLNGLKVELAAERLDRLVDAMNEVLAVHGINLTKGSFVSSGDMNEEDAFLRLCRADYDVRVDMVIHPFPPFAGNLPCEVRFLSFDNMAIPDGEGPGTMRHITPASTYSWMHSDFASLGNAVALVQFDQSERSALRDELVEYIDLKAETQPGLLTKFDAAIWAGQNPTTD